MAQNGNSVLENGMQQRQLSSEIRSRGGFDTTKNIPTSEHRWTGQHHDKSPKEKNWTGRMQQPRRITSTPAPEPNPLTARPSREKPQRTRNGSSKWATRGAGPGMQAIFLGQNQSCGTGVFLPRIVGSDSQLLPNKPAYPPVLLPCRVVQTLNLNVHEVGKQLKPHTDRPKTTVKRNEESNKNKKLDVEYISPDIYLPKEWTY